MEATPAEAAALPWRRRASGPCATRAGSGRVERRDRRHLRPPRRATDLDRAAGSSLSAIFLGARHRRAPLQARRGARRVKPLGDATDRAGADRPRAARRPGGSRGPRAARRDGAGAPARPARRGWSVRRARSWSGPAATASTAAASGSARRTSCPGDRVPICCSPCGRTRRASPLSRTGTSPVRSGGCGGCSGAVPACAS